MANQPQVITIPPDIIEQGVNLANQLTTLLAPYMEALSAQERHGILKMGDKTIAFVSKALEYAQANPQFAPPYMNTKELADDVAVANGLTQIEQPVQSLSLQLDDTIMVAGSHAYAAALMYYKAVKAATVSNVPGAKAIYDDLSIRFDRVRKKDVPANNT